MTHASTDRQILVISHTARPEAIYATRAVVKALREHGVQPVMQPEDLREFEPHIDTTAILSLADTSLERVEIALVLGGDGTILRAAELVRESECPIVGVNLGHVGFLAEMEHHDLREAVERVLAKKYTVEQRVTLDVVVELEGEEIARSWALNEATVEKQQRMIEVAVSVDRRQLTSFGCDGVVMATPTGSTAYAFSAGGPVLWPGVNALLVVPIAAHALFNRPFVVGPQSVVETTIAPASSSAAFLWCDGRRKFEVPKGATVRVTVSNHPVRLARLDEGVFTSRLVRKFHLPVEGLRSQNSAAVGTEMTQPITVVTTEAQPDA